MAAPTSTLVRRADCPTLATIKLKADSKGMPCSDSSCGRLHRTKLIDFQLGPVSRESPVCVYPLKAANKDGNIAPLSLAVVIPSDPTKPDFDRYINMMKMVKELNTAPVIVDGRKVAIIKRQLFTIQDLENSISTDGNQCAGNLVNARSVMKSAVQRYWDTLHLFNEAAKWDTSLWRFDSNYETAQIIGWPKETWFYGWEGNSVPVPTLSQEDIDDEMAWFAQIIESSFLPTTICPSDWVKASAATTGGQAPNGLLSAQRRPQGSR